MRHLARLWLTALLLLPAAAWALSDNTFDNNPMTLGASGVEAIRIISKSQVGIGMITPTVSLEVSGTISATNLYVGGLAITGAGASKLASLTDVTATAPANNSLLRFNSTSSKWEAVGIDSGISTTTMLAGWPDAILCQNGSYPGYYNALYGPVFYTAGPPRIYRYYSGSGNWVAFNADTGAATSDVGAAVASCNGKSVSTLYASGQAFNFIGNNGGSSGSALGDRIVSGSLIAVANSATGYISLTTNGTNWGYLSSGANYLPNLNTPLVSSTAGGVVSATYGYFKYISATNGLGGTGVSALASLTDVSVSSVPMSGGILTYANGKWQAISPSQILSTTTMLPNWPDAIKCSNGSANTELYLAYHDASNVYYININSAAPGSNYIGYNVSTYAYVAQSNMGSYDCVTSTYSIPTLYTMGRAFNFIGTSGSGSTALGDRITSGTLVAVANSATGYISLTTNGTNWGYLSSGANYLPNLNTPLVSSTAGGAVSATYGYFKYISATSGLGGGSMATLTDVSETGVADGMLLRYNGSSSKWESVGASTALSQTTMQPNWPDAITCTASGTDYIFWRNTPTRYAYYNGTTFYTVVYNGSGNYSSNSNSSTFDCVSQGYSLSQLYAVGRAFNFIGGQYGGSANQIIFHNGAQGIGDNNLQWISGTAALNVTGKVSATNISTTALTVNGVAITGSGSALGDRIVSTSANIVAYAGGTISLTTGGVSGTSYFNSTGTWVGPGISTTGIISSTGLFVAGNISATGTISATGNMFAAAYLHNSDRRLKDNIKTIAQPFTILNAINGVHFTWKKDGSASNGVIAQDIQKVMPEAVQGGPDSMMSVDYDQLFGPLVEAVKQLKADNDNLRQEFEAYKRAHP